MKLDDLAGLAHFAVQGLMDCAVNSVRDRVSERGRLSVDKLEAEQHAVHGLAWLATYVEAIKEMADRVATTVMFLIECMATLLLIQCCVPCISPQT